MERPASCIHFPAFGATQANRASRRLSSPRWGAYAPVTLGTAPLISSAARVRALILLRKQLQLVSKAGAGREDAPTDASRTDEKHSFPRDPDLNPPDLTSAPTRDHPRSHSHNGNGSCESHFPERTDAHLPHKTSPTEDGEYVLPGHELSASIAPSAGHAGSVVPSIVASPGAEVEEEFREQERRRGRLMLLLVAVLWGSYGVLVREVFLLPHPPPVSIFTFIRKGMAAALFLLVGPVLAAAKKTPDPSTAGPSEGPSVEGSGVLGLREGAPSHPPANTGGPAATKSGDRSSPIKVDDGSLSLVVLPGLELGLWQFLGMSFQALGLGQTSATRAGFLIQTTNVLVPLIASALGDAISPSTWTAAVIAMAGVVTMGLASEAKEEPAPQERPQPAPEIAAMAVTSSGGPVPDVFCTHSNSSLFSLPNPGTLSPGLCFPTELDIQGVSSESLCYQMSTPDISSAVFPTGSVALDLSADGSSDHLYSLALHAESGQALPSAADLPDPMADGLLSGPSILGDVDVLVGALFYSISTVRLGKHLQTVDPYKLSVASMVSATVFAGAWAAVDLVNAQVSGEGAASLFVGWVHTPEMWGYTFLAALGPGTLSTLLQAYGQRVVAPAQAQVLYSLQPLFSAALAMAFLQESLPALGWLGGSLVILAALLSA